jgi:putative N-acetylmannosamine-6-phosphate epimerase
MFANIADFIYLNYGVLDNDSSGTLSDTEVEGFTELQTDGISVDGLGTGLAAYNNNYEVVIGDNHYIANSNLTKCSPYTGESNGRYTDNASHNTTCAARALALGTSITEIRPIFKLDNMTDITAGGTLNTLVSMVSELSMISTALSSDFDSVGISSENIVRKLLTLGLSKLDNGAKDNNPTANAACTAVILFDVMFLLVKNAADNSTTESELKSANLINTADLINAVDGSLSLLPAGASDVIKALPMKSARIVYATSSGYTDSYEKAESSLYEAMKNTRSLGTDDSIKGDGKVTFRELICVAEN